VSPWSEGERSASPHYSQSILEDMFVDEHVEYLKEASAGAAHLEEACVLLKVWAVQVDPRLTQG